VPAMGVQDTVLRDLSGFGNHGTPTNTDPSDWAVRSGAKVRGYSLDLNGTDEFVAIGNVALLEGKENMTVSVWARTDAVAADSVIIGKNESGAPFEGWNITLKSATEINGSVQYDGVTQTQGVSTLSPDLTVGWHNIVFISRARVPHLYVDGVELVLDDTNTTGVGSIITTSANVTIGAIDDTAADLFDGKIAEARIYNRAFTDAEVVTNYENFLAPFRLRSDLVGGLREGVVGDATRQPTIGSAILTGVPGFMDFGVIVPTEL